MESRKKQIYVITAYYKCGTDAYDFYTTSIRKAEKKMKDLEADESVGMLFLEEFDLI